MSKKDVPAYITENEVFPTRLREIMKLRNTNQTRLATKIKEDYGVTIQRQSISKYMNGQTKPDVDTITIICKALNVSADYLLGISDIPSCDPDILRVCEFTGLSQNTAVQLGLLNNSGDKNIRFIKRFLDKIVSYQDISSLENLIFSSAEALYIARNSKSGNSWGRAKTNNMMFTENEGVFSISAIEAAEYYRSLALKNVSQKIDSVFHNMVDELCEEMEAQNGIDET